MAGTLSDLDVLIDHGGPIRRMVLHRAETHTLFWLTLFSLPFAAAVAVAVHDRSQCRQELSAQRAEPAGRQACGRSSRHRRTHRCRGRRLARCAAQGAADARDRWPRLREYRDRARHAYEYRKVPIYRVREAVAQALRPLLNGLHHDRALHDEITTQQLVCDAVAGCAPDDGYSLRILARTGQAKTPGS